MQSIAGYPTDLTVTEPTALIIVGGNPVEAESVTISRELSSNLPAQVTSASGMTAATGSVEWSVGDDVRTRAAHPWDGNAFPPKPSDEVVVFMGYGSTMARQLTGIVDSSVGAVADGEVSSDLVDRIDKLRQPVTFPAMLRTMPPTEEGGPQLPVNCSATFITDRILRACGFYATPPTSGGVVVSVPLMGSSWPEVGRVKTSGRRNDPVFPPLFNRSDWGMAASNIDASYEPGPTSSAVLDRPVQITLKARKTVGTVGNTLVRAYWGTSNSIELMVTPSRRIVGLINGYGVLELSAAAAASAEVFTLRVSPEGAFTIFANNGQTVTGSRAIPAAMKTTPMSEVLILSPEGTGVNIGGVQVNWTATGVYNSPQTAILTDPATPNGLAAFPRIEGRIALDVLKEQAEAECAAMWIDEFGVFRWVNRNRLLTSPTAATMTALDDVLDVGWESDSRGVRSKVVLLARDPSVRRSSVANHTCWQGSGGSMDEGQVDVQLVSPPADTDWVGVDDRGNLANNIDGWQWRFNRGRGSWMGGVEVSDDNERWAQLNNPGFASSIEHIGNQTYKITTTAGNPSAGYTIELRTPAKEYTAGLRQHKTEYELPVLRAMAIVDWADITVTGTARGPADAAALEHQVGPWVQDPSGLQELADWLAAQVSAPRPVLRDLAVVPDFRRQLGDVVWVEDPDNMRIRLRVLLTKISTTVSLGSASQTVAGQILEVRSYGVTNAQLDAHAGRFTNTGFDTLWAGGTNAQLDADPLGRG
jgi:hypothetical protein